MGTKNPRLNVVLDRSLYKAVQTLAGQEGVSMSLKARDLIREALDIFEDSYWARSAREREDHYPASTALPHDKVWSKLLKAKKGR